MPVSGDTITVECACGKRLKAPASAVGRRAKCPACASVLTIELPPPPPDIPEEDDPLAGMYELAETEKAAAKRSQLDDSPRCPKCASAMAAGAVLCTNCGFDARSNKKVSTAPIPKPVIDYGKPAKKKRDKMAPDGSFMIGLLASFGGALVGGLIWFLVTWGTGYDIYLVCLLIGIGAGLGMQMGQKGYSTLGGYSAAGITLVVLMLARLALVLAILLPMLKHGLIHPHSSGTASAQTSSGQADDVDDVDDSADDQTGQTDQTPVATNNSSHGKSPTAITSSPASSSSTSSTPTHHSSASAAIGGLVILLLLFGWKGALFTILTLFMAYRTASGSVSGQTYLFLDQG